jgi:exonuclease III
LLSPGVAERLVSAVPDKQARAEDTPSDHVPLVMELG